MGANLSWTFSPSRYAAGAERPDCVADVRGWPVDPTSDTVSVEMLDALTDDAVVLAGTPTKSAPTSRDPGDGTTVYDFTITYPWQAGELDAVASYILTFILTASARTARVAGQVEVV